MMRAEAAILELASRVADLPGVTRQFVQHLSHAFALRENCGGRLEGAIFWKEPPPYGSSKVFRFCRPFGGAHFTYASRLKDSLPVLWRAEADNVQPRFVWIACRLPHQNMCQIVMRFARR